MVADYTNMVGVSGAYLSTLTLSASEVTERAKLPMLTLSYSDLITDRGFKYIFQTWATAGSQTKQAMPVVLKVAKSAGGDPKTVAIITDNTAASIASVKPMREGLLAKVGLKIVVDETFTPPLSDATPLVQKVRAARPDLLFFLPTVISDAKLVLEKMNEFGMGQGKVPTMAFGIAMFEPDMLQTMSPDLLQGMIGSIGSWGAKGHEAMIAELKRGHDHVLIDSAPVLPVGDTLSIGRLADAIYLIVRSEENTQREVRDAVRRLEIAGGDVEGLVLNGVKRHRLASVPYSGYMAVDGGGRALALPARSPARGR